MAQVQLFRVVGIAEADVLKVHAAVRHLGEGVFGGDDVALLPQDLHDALGAGGGHGDHHEYHGQHDQAGENLDYIGDHAHQLAGSHAHRRVVA